ncbi:hypothetical protein LOK49_LG02G02691 [Camellia lanceoleosa]|uniref:Uncharacterized protein n=1 Tax=Camellia lanceoleosa TaxID=1840588 RepID=A0ACC0IJP6_9ERIC|nr:hypothetical protein LOK49_LG02G02691 [Camellia lanceoleosa]
MADCFNPSSLILFLFLIRISLVQFQSCLMAAEVAAGAAVMGALCQAKTAFWAPIVDTIASSNDMKEIYTALNEAVAMLKG